MDIRIIVISCMLTVVLAASSLLAQTGNRVLLNGYSSFEFEKQFGDEGKGDPNGSFDADLFDIVLNVYATDRLRIAADFSWEHGAATEDGRGNVVVEYGFGEYLVTEGLKIRAGKMFTHFSIYNEIHTAKPAFLSVKEPLSTNKNDKFGSATRFYPRWVSGLAVLGNYTLGEVDADYIVQVTNGEQETTNPFEEDDNGQKAISGRLRFYPAGVGQVGVSVYTDQLTELDSLGEDSGERTSQVSFGAHADINLADLGLEVEFVTGSLSPSVGEKLTRNAFTAMLFYPIQDIVVPYVRFEYLDPNTAVEEDQANMVVAGLNFQVDDGLFVKVELNSISSGDNNDRFSGKNYSELKAAIAIGF